MISILGKTKAGSYIKKIPVFKQYDISLWSNLN